MTSTATPYTKGEASRLRLQAAVTTWVCAGLVAAGVAWVLGLEAAWWQRALMTLAAAALIALDLRDTDAVIDIRVTLTHGIAALGWLQTPLTVAGGAWLLGMDADVFTRLTLAAVIGSVAALFHYAPAGGAA